MGRVDVMLTDGAEVVSGGTIAVSSQSTTISSEAAVTLASGGAVSVASQSVLQKQRILASFYEVLVPKLQALGQVGTLAQQRLAMLMADAGVMEGTPTPASEDELNMVVGQAVAALKRYVTSSMMAPMVAPMVGPKGPRRTRREPPRRGAPRVRPSGPRCRRRRPRARLATRRL